ncbi:MAG: hypothetical protein JSV03_00465 [Planctomycetota bacterium]|nr:MAG: hypothetical protein JSV03_00465 [Planctomycetota bacterium]
MLLPPQIKKFLAIFRGEVAPVMILLSTALGFWFGLTPGWYGVHVALLAIALILNIHVGIFLLSAALGKSLCYAAAPIMFHIGAWTQDALSPLLRFFAAIPIIGITDFTRYSVAGATLIGPLIGLLLGLLLSRSVVSFRRQWLKLEEGSEAFKKWRSKKWVRLLDRILISKSAKDAQSVLTRKPKLVRKAGVILAVVLLVVSAVAINLVQDKLTADYAADTLTQLNGAEVNLDQMELAVLSGNITASGIQVTDPENPQNNSVAIEELTAKASLWNLLLGRVVIDNLSLSNVGFDRPRETAGKVLTKTTESQEPQPFESSQYQLPDSNVNLLYDYFKDAQAIKERLKQISEWLPEAAEDKKPATQEKPVPQSYLEYLSARAPVSKTPRIIVRQIELDKVEIPAEQFGNSTIACNNMNDAPEAAGLPIRIQVKSNDKPTTLEILSHYDSPENGATIKAGFADVDLKQLQAKMNQSNPVSFQGGTASGSIQGKATRHTIDLAIKLKIKDLQAQSAGGVLGMDPKVTSEAMKVLNNIETTLRLVGPISEPRLVFDGPAMRKEFSDALVSAGKKELAKQITGLAGEHLPGAGVDGTAVMEKPLEAGKDIAGDLLGGKPKQADDKKKEDRKPTEDPLFKLKNKLNKSK